MFNWFLIFTLLLQSTFPFPGPGRAPAAAGGGNNITIVNSTGCFGAPSGDTVSETCTTSFSPTNGNSLLVWTYSDPQSGGTGTLSCSDAEGTGNTYNEDRQAHTNSVFTGSLRRATNISGSGTYVITCTLSAGSGFIGIVVVEVSNLAGTPLDGTNGAVATSTNPNPGNITTTNANDLLISCFGDSSGSNSALTVPTNYVDIQSTGNGAANFVGGCARQLVTATNTYVGQWTYAVNARWSSVHVAYKSN